MSEKNKKPGRWVTICGRHIFIEEGQTPSQAMKASGKFSAEEVDKAAGAQQKKMTPAEKIASVHIDFKKDNILPELNDEDLEQIGLSKNKRVLLKEGIINRNKWKHNDLSDEDVENIIKYSLYSPIEVFKADIVKNYYHFAAFVEIKNRSKFKMGLCLLDITDGGEFFEIVHAHVVGSDGYDKAHKKS